LPPLHTLSPAGTRRRLAEKKTLPESSTYSSRSSPTEVEVAVNLTIPLLSPSGSRASPLRPDLTPLLLDPGNTIAHQRRRQSPELTVMSSTPSRAPSPLHARPLAENHPLNCSATDPLTADHQPSLDKRADIGNPSSPRRHRMHASSRKEEGSRAVRSESDGGVPLRPHQAQAGRQIWAGLARVRYPGPSFFSVI
jgi:hypothetical protein